MVSGTASVTPIRIEVTRVGGIAGARNDHDVASQRAHLSHDFVDRVRRGNRDDHGLGVHHPACLEEFRERGVAVIDLASASPLFGHGVGVIIDGKIGTAVPVQQGADDLSYPAVADDDGMSAAADRRNGEFRVERPGLPESRHQSPRHQRQRRNQRHGDRRHRQDEAGYVERRPARARWRGRCRRMRTRRRGRAEDRFRSQRTRAGGRYGRGRSAGRT